MESKTAGGIFLPESALEKLNEAKVLAVGPGALDREGKRLPMGVREGDRVLIPQVCDESEESEFVGRGRTECKRDMC
jgi:co-chaperonin GroES (HSP10)